MTASSLIAFALVFFTTSAFSSLVLGLGVRLAARRLRALGVRAEKRAAALTLLVPPTLGLLLVAVLAVDSVRSLLSGTDHCADHAHHLHICLAHGAEWATRPWAVEALTLVGCFTVVRLGQLGWAHALGQRASWRFRRLGEPLADAGRAVCLPLDEPVVFTAGALAPTVVISRGAWNLLGPEERRAVLAHELAHVAGGDIWRRAMLGCLSCFSMPGLASFVLRLWDHSAERLCDRHAADVVGRPSVVASAIVSLARGMRRGQAPPGAVFVGSGDVADRVRALLDGEADGAPGAALVSRWCLGSAVAIAVAAAVLAGQLHHFFETILG